MCVGYLGFVLLVWFPGVLHAQSAAQSCDAPELTGGFLVPDQVTYNHGEKLTYACDMGLKPAVEGWWVTITCQNSQWSHVPQCISETACIPPDIPNGDYPKNPNGWYGNEQVLRIKCDDGYEHEGFAATTTCRDGKWSTFPVCKKSTNSCGPPPEFLHAVVILQRYKKVFAADSRVQYECKNGYTAEQADKTTIICISGAWTEGPTCREETSTAPSTGQDGSATVGQNGGQPASDGSGTQPAVEGGRTGQDTGQGQGTSGGETPPAERFCVLYAGDYAEGFVLHRDLTVKEEVRQLVSCGWPHDPHNRVVHCTTGKITISECCRPNDVIRGACRYDTIQEISLRPRWSG